MPQIKSAKKRMRQNEKRAKRNRQIKNRTKNSIKEFLHLIDQKNLEEAKKRLPQLISIIDSTWAKGVWPKNKVARQKARIMKKLNKIGKD